MVMKGSNIQKGVTGEKIGNEGKVGKESGLSMIVFLLQIKLRAFSSI